jgi:phosphatidylinositol dimannoside acyltransferase
VKERLVDLGFAAGWAAVKALPEPVAARAFAAGADLALRRRGPGVRRLEGNLRRVVGGQPSPRLMRAALRSYARYWLETFRLPVMDKAALAAATQERLEGMDVLDKAYADGRGVVAVLPHSGNWDVAAVWLIAHGIPFTTVVERLRPESLYRRFVAYRESLGMEVLPLTGGPRPASEVLAERLRAGGMVCLVGDRDLTRGGVQVDFFGEPATMPAGPALLAVTTGAALMPVGLWYEGARCGVRLHPIVPVPAQGRLRERVQAATQAVADRFAADIAQHPEDWHMLQRLWLADRGPALAPQPPAVRTVAPPAAGTVRERDTGGG